jgi:acyl-coenzyme A thioesterase PaaI-like protein
MPDFQPQDVALPYRADLAQQNGYLHAGIVTAIVDTACGFAAYSLMPPGYDVLNAVQDRARAQLFVGVHGFSREYVHTRPPPERAHAPLQHL